MGMASEMYTFGTQLWMGVAGETVAYIVCYFMFLPVLYNLQLTSVYEYFGKRFGGRVKKLTSTLFLVKEVNNFFNSYSDSRHFF